MSRGMNILEIQTDAVELTVTVDVPFVVTHSLGRPVSGWIIVWADAYLVLKVVNPAEDTRNSITLVANGSGRIRLAFLS